jgi:outer membrane protein
MRPMHALTALLCLSTLASSPLSAADLLDVYELARQRDTRFQVEQAELEATQQLRPQAISALLPQLNFNTQYVREELEIDRAARRDSDSFNTEGYSLRLDQVIYDHALIVQLRQADKNIAQAQAEFNSAAQTLIVRVSGAYFGVLAAQENLVFARTEKEAIAAQLEQAEKQFKAGLVSDTDIKEAQAAYDLAIAREVAAENRLAISRESLQLVTGKLPENLKQMGDEIPLITPEPADIEAWVATALAQNPQLLAAQFTTETASLEIARRQAEHYPTLGLFAAKINNDAGGGIFGARETDDEVVGVRLNVPIFSGGLVAASTREASFLLKRAQELQELQRRETIRQTRSSYLNVIAGVSRVKALWLALESNRAAADATRTGFEHGTRTSADVLLALRDLFRAQRNLSQARYNYLLETLRLEQAAGTLTLEDLVALNAWLH